MFKSLTLNFKSLFTESDSVHLFQINLQQKIINWNAKQEETSRKLLSLKSNKINLLNLSIEEIYAYDPIKLEKIFLENEAVLQTERIKIFNSILIIPGYSKVKLRTTKLPTYNGKNRLTGIFGIANYISEFSLEKSIQYGLSTRETECLEHLLNGDTSMSIAKKLHLSNRTVDDYVDNIKNKLGCKNRKELILKCDQIGFLKKFY